MAAEGQGRSQADGETYMSGLQRVFEGFEQSIKEKAQEWDSERDALLEQISSLQSENAHLKQQLEDERRKTADLPPAQSAPERQADAADEPQDRNGAFGAFSDELSRMTKKYNDLRQRSMVYEQAYEKLKKKYEDAKNSVKEWQRYAERHRKRKATVDPKSPVTPAPPETRTEVAKIDFAQAGGDNMPDPSIGPTDNNALSFSSNPEPPAGAGDFAAVPGDRDLPSDLPATTSTTERITSSQTTQDEEPPSSSTERRRATSTADQPFEDSDDTPVVVSTRALKRKRGPITVFDDSRLAEGTPTRPVRIKDEPLSSPPDTVIRIPRLRHQDTLDLDEIGLSVDTPRKRQRMQKLLEHARRTSLLQHESSSSVPPETGVAQGNEDGVAPETLDAMEADDTVLVKTERASSEPGHSSPILYKDGVHQTSSADQTRKPLHPVTPNTRLLPWTSNKSGRRKEGNRGAEHIHLLSEDGESGSQGARPTANEPPAEGEGLRRLENLLQAPTPEKHALQTTPGSGKAAPRAAFVEKTASKLPAKTPLFKKPAKLQLDTPPTTVGRSRAEAPSTTNNRPNTATAPGRKTRAGALRNRPLARLTAADFKPNPRYNQGLDYAFSEAVRGRDNRRCLAGCTRPECCGNAFRALAEAGAVVPRPRRLFESSQEEEAEGADGGLTEEERLLKDHLGPRFHVAIVRSMPADERRELVVQARQKALADRFGKHRAAYERQRTPPGFWEADFPSTQEIERQREEARRREKERVEEMWGEAMREGGRWLFRDE